MMQIYLKMTETLENGYSSESTQEELSNEYQDDMVQMVFKDLCILVLLAKVISLSIERVNEVYLCEHRCEALIDRC